MTSVIVMGFHQIIVVMNNVKRHTYIHTYIPALTGEKMKLSLQLIVYLLHCDRKRKGTWN